MRPVSELDVYEIAYLCGGPERVALAAVAAMARDGRIRISRTRHRVRVVHRRGSQPVEHAVLDAVPDSGKVLGPLLAGVAHSAAVAELIDGLRRGGLVGHHSLAGHSHLSTAGRQVRKGWRTPARRFAATGGSRCWARPASRMPGCAAYSKPPIRRRAASWSPGRASAAMTTSRPIPRYPCIRGYLAAGKFARMKPSWPLPATCTLTREEAGQIRPG
jgi:hypothetical protein